ncbi:uncharacterized protein ACIQIH_003479 [Cyanocitta cristata]
MGSCPPQHAWIPKIGGVSRRPLSFCPARERFAGCAREERREGDWDNSWSGLFIPVGNTSLYGLQDAVGSLGTKRASNVKAPFEEEIVLLRPHAWTLEGMAQWSDMKAPSLRAETLLCIMRLARKSARGPWSSQASGIKHNNPLHTM